MYMYPYENPHSQATDCNAVTITAETPQGGFDTVGAFFPYKKGTLQLVRI